MASITVTNGDIEALAPVFVDALVETLEPLNAFALGIESDAKEEGDTAKVVVYSKFSDGVTFDVDTQNYEDEQAEGVEFKPVVLDTHKKHTISLQDKQRRGYSKEKLMQLQGQAMGRTILKDVYAKILAATFTDSINIGLPSAFDSDLFADFWLSMDQALWAPENRTAILLNTYMGNLLKDNDLKNADAAGDTGLLRQAKFSPLYDIQPISSQILPTNGENLVGILANGNGIGIGMAPVVVDDGDGAEGVVNSFMVQAPGGVTVGFRTHYAPASGKRFMTTELLYGIAELQPASLIRLTSA